MSARIHPSAIVHEDAIIADGVVIEAYARIGPKVSIGEGTHVQHGAVVAGRTTLGKHNLLYPYAILGTDPQDLKYNGEDTILTVGDHNTFREHCTINKGTEQGGGKTVIGDHNLFMATAHVGHDSIIGNHCVFSFGSGLAGHIVIDDYAVFGGMTGSHQFVRIGTHAFVSGGSKSGMDLAPYCVCQGSPARLRGINSVGLERRGFSKDEIAAIRLAYRRFFVAHDDRDPVERVRSEFGDEPPEVIKTFLAFVEAPSDRGLMRPNRRKGDD